jgi:hypothetical protein
MSGAEASTAHQPTVTSPNPDRSAAPMKRALMVLCTLYATTIVALRWIGIQPAVPWSLLPLLVLVVIPFALGATGAVSLAAGNTRPEHPMTRARCVLLGAVFLLAYRVDSPLFLLGHVVLFPIIVRNVWRSGLARPLTLMTGALAVGYATIWNLNYLVAMLSNDRLADPAVRRLDIALYQLIFRGPSTTSASSRSSGRRSSSASSRTPTSCSCRRSLLRRGSGSSPSGT